MSGKKNDRKEKKVSDKKQIRNELDNKAAKKREKKKYTSVSNYYDMSDKGKGDTPDPEAEKAAAEKLKRKKAIKKSMAVKKFLSEADKSKAQNEITQRENKRSYEEETHRREEVSAEDHHRHTDSGTSVSRSGTSTYNSGSGYGTSSYNSSGSYTGSGTYSNNGTSSYSAEPNSSSDINSSASSSGNNTPSGNTSSVNGSSSGNSARPDMVDHIGTAINVAGSAAKAVTEVEAAMYKGDDVSTAAAETFIQSAESAVGFVKNVSDHRKQQQEERKKEAEIKAKEEAEKQQRETVKNELKKHTQIADFGKAQAEEKQREQSRFDRLYNTLMSDVTLPETNDIANALRSEVHIPILSDIEEALNTDVSELLDIAKMSEEQRAAAQAEKEAEKKAKEEAEKKAEEARLQAEEQRRSKEEQAKFEEEAHRERSQKYRDYEKIEEFKKKQEEKILAERIRTQNKERYKETAKREEFDNREDEKQEELARIETLKRDAYIRREAQDILDKLEEDKKERSSREKNIEIYQNSLHQKKMRNDNFAKREEERKKAERLARERERRDEEAKASGTASGGGSFNTSDSAAVFNKHVGIGALVYDEKSAAAGGQAASAVEAQAAAEALMSENKALETAKKAFVLAHTAARSAAHLTKGTAELGKKAINEASGIESDMSSGNNLGDGAAKVLYRPAEKVKKFIGDKAEKALKGNLKRDAKAFRTKHDLLAARRKKLTAQRKFYEQIRQRKADFYKHIHGMDGGFVSEAKKFLEDILLHHYHTAAKTGGIVAAMPAILPVILVVVVFALIACLFLWVNPFSYVISGKAYDEYLQNGGMRTWVVTDEGTFPPEYLKKKAETDKEIINAYLTLVQDYGTLTQAHVYSSYGDWAGGYWAWGDCTLSFDEYFGPVEKQMRANFQKRLSEAVKKWEEESEKPEDEEEAKAYAEARQQFIEQLMQEFDIELTKERAKAFKEFNKMLADINDQASAHETWLPHEGHKDPGRNGRPDSADLENMPIPDTNFFEDCEIKTPLSANDFVAYIAIYKTLDFIDKQTNGEGESMSSSEGFSITMYDIVDFFDKTGFFDVEAKITSGYTCPGCTRVWLHPGQKITFKDGNVIECDPESSGQFVEFCPGGHKHLHGRMKVLDEYNTEADTDLVRSIMELTNAEENGISVNDIFDLKEAYLDYMDDVRGSKTIWAFVNKAKADEYYKVLAGRLSPFYLLNDNCGFKEHFESDEEEEEGEEGEDPKPEPEPFYEIS